MSTITSKNSRIGFAAPKSTAPVGAAPAGVRDKFATTRRELSEALIERDGEIDVVLTALLCGENPLLVGDPGTGKSFLLDAVMGWMGGRTFTVLFNKFTTPEEVFGPVSVAGLKADQFRRITTGKLPEADGAFADEIFKASSAILNTMLRILNERVYDNGDGMLRKVPLKICVAASNEWPQAENGGKELGALFDRFLFRKVVRPIAGQASMRRLLWKRDHSPRLTTTLSPEELEQARTGVAALEWTEEAMEAMEQIIRELAKEGVRPGDRRKFKAVAAAQAFAYLNGAERVEPEHLEILAHVLWDDPQEQPEKAAKVVARVANPVGMMVNQFIMEAEQVIAETDVRDLRSAATASAKLTEIGKKLAGLKKDPAGRAEKAIEYLREEVRKLKKASIEAI